MASRKLTQSVKRIAPESKASSLTGRQLCCTSGKVKLMEGLQSSSFYCFSSWEHGRTERLRVASSSLLVILEVLGYHGPASAVLFAFPLFGGFILS
jgi:hypothetical protein